MSRVRRSTIQVPTSYPSMCNLRGAKRSMLAEHRAAAKRERDEARR